MITAHVPIPFTQYNRAHCSCIRTQYKHRYRQNQGPHRDLVDPYEISISQVTMDFFPFLRRLFLSFITDTSCIGLDYKHVCNMEGVSPETPTAYPPRTAWLLFESNLFNFLCCVVIFALFVFVLYLVCPMLQASLDCQLLISPPAFSNVYLHRSR